MKYTTEYLKKIGITISSEIDKITFSPRFIFKYEDGYSQSIEISRTTIEDIKANGILADYYIERMIENFLNDHLKYVVKTRKEKIEKLNDKSNEIFG